MLMSFNVEVEPTIQAIVREVGMPATLEYMRIYAQMAVEAFKGHALADELAQPYARMVEALDLAIDRIDQMETGLQDARKHDGGRRLRSDSGGPREKPASHE